MGALTALAAQLPEDIQHIKTVGDIEEYQLESNGLRILLHPNELLPVAAVMVTYEVGGRNEVTGTTGATHILEHMMFKGTQTFQGESDYSHTMERIGARSNATTYYDRTNYYAVLPREYVNKAIELEADRMRNLRITAEDLESEMTVVRNEYERGENNPTRTLIKEMYASAFMAHPYGHPVIGWKSDIESTSPDKLRAFYDQFYWPENATLTVIGGFDKLATLEAVRKYYGAVPKAPHKIPSLQTVEPEQLGPRRVTIERSGEVGVIAIGYKAPQGVHEDWAALNLISQILGADKTGRLYRALDDKGKASSTFAFAPQLRDPSLFFLGAFLTPDSTHQEVERIILEEIARMTRASVSEEELARAKSVIKASTVYGRDGPYAIADAINEYIAMGDWAGYITLPQAIEAVTIEDIQRVADKYFFSNNSTTGWYVPTTPTVSASLATPQPNYFRDPELFPQQSADEIAVTPTSHNAKRQDVHPAEPQGTHFAQHIQQATIGDIEVIAIDMPIENVVSFVGSFAAGETLGGVDAPSVASLTAAMLDKGTSRQDRFVIAEQLDNLGATISFSTQPHSLEFSGKFLREDAGAVISLLAEQLREPAFAPDVFESLKSRRKGNLLQALNDPGYRGSNAVNRLLYPQSHPNYRPQITTLLEKLETVHIDDIIAFHREHYGPKSMRLVFAGDIDFEQLTAAVESAFDGWGGGIDYPTTHPTPDQPRQHSERIEIADKPSVSTFLAQYTGLQRTDPDYIPFYIGNYILGGSFHSRLMSEVRVKQGLTYHIDARHSGDILTPGNWVLSATFAPAMLDAGLAAARNVVNDWYNKGVSEEETKAAITTLSGSYLVRLSTTAAVAQQVHSFLQRGFAADYIDQYPSKLHQVRAPIVNQAIRQYFQPDELLQVIAGTLNEAPKAEASPKTDTGSNDTRAIHVRLDVPDASWTIAIEKIYRTRESLVVISQLRRPKDALGAQVISTVSDSVNIPAATSDLPIRHYILGKTWNWGAAPEYSFIDSTEAFGGGLDTAELLYSRE